MILLASSSWIQLILTLFFVPDGKQILFAARLNACKSIDLTKMHNDSGLAQRGIVRWCVWVDLSSKVMAPCKEDASSFKFTLCLRVITSRDCSLQTSRRVFSTWLHSIKFHHTRYTREKDIIYGLNKNCNQHK